MQIWLHHHDTAVGVKPTYVFARQAALLGILQLIAACVQARQADSWLDYPGTALGKRPSLPWSQPLRRDNWNAAGGKVAQVTFVCIPREHGCRVGQTRDARCPFEEFSSASGIVPAGAHDDKVEARPVDVRIVPDRRRRLDSTRSERRYEPPRVRVELRQFAAGGEATFRNVDSFIIIMGTEYNGGTFTGPDAPI